MSRVRVELQFMAPPNFTVARLYKDGECVLTRGMYGPAQTLRVLDNSLCRNPAESPASLCDEDIADARACIQRLIDEH